MSRRNLPWKHLTSTCRPPSCGIIWPESELKAWIRTGLTLMGFGFVVARFGLFLEVMQLTRGTVEHQSHLFSRWVGTAFVVTGVAVNLLSMRRHLRLVAQLQPRASSTRWRIPRRNWPSSWRCFSLSSKSRSCVYVGLIEASPTRDFMRGPFFTHPIRQFKRPAIRFADFPDGARKTVAGAHHGVERANEIRHVVLLISNT